MRILIMLAAAGGLAAVVLMVLWGSQNSAGGRTGLGYEGPPARGPLATGPQDARPPSPQREAWRWTLTVLGIFVVTAVVVGGVVLIARSLWSL